MTRYLLTLVAVATAYAQLGPAPAKPKPPRNAKEGAPVDFTGYWVSVVTEDWRWRMVTPIKGDFASIPLTPAARAVGNAWDPAKDEAAGEQCRSYGAPAIMRIPGRLHIIWADDNTLQIDADQGTQTRLLHFGGKPVLDRRPRGKDIQSRNGSLRCAGLARRSRVWGPHGKACGDDRSK